MRISSFIFCSLLFHMLLLGSFIFRFSFEKKLSPPPIGIMAEVISSAPKSVGIGQARKNGNGSRIDLRPPSMSNDHFSISQQKAKDAGLGAFVHQQLHADSNSLIAFDLLAERINHFLEYPDLLIENGVEGVASLDLYFDNEGLVDEMRSAFGGDNRMLRGIFVRATRTGLTKWYLSDAYRLKKNQFRNQHFHAEFALSAVAKEDSRVEKTGTDAYAFRRHRMKDYCLRPGAVDLSCLTIKAYGAVYNTVSRRHKVMFDNLQYELDYFDRKGLSGIRSVIDEERMRSG